MPTLLQLQAEPVWNAERVTEAVDWLGDNLCARTGRPRTAFGAKGDEFHLRGAHRSQRWILTSRYCTNRGYTVQNGLTESQKDEIAGIDFTPGNGQEMIQQSRRLYEAMRAGLLDEVFEFYGNIDGNQIVDGWDNIDDENITSDTSHLWHWHLTLDRRQLNNMNLMRRILATALGDPMTQPDVALTPSQNAALAETWAANVALRDGKPVPKAGNHPGGPHNLNVKLEALLREVGRLTVEMANLKTEINSIETAVTAILEAVTTVPQTIQLDPVTLSGELRFGNPTS